MATTATAPGLPEIEQARARLENVARVTPERQGKNETGRMQDPAAGQPVKLALDLPAGDYRVEWLDPKEGKPPAARELKHAGGQATLESPAFTQDVAVRITAGK